MWVCFKHRRITPLRKSLFQGVGREVQTNRETSDSGGAVHPNGETVDSIFSLKESLRVIGIPVCFVNLVYERFP